MVEKERHWTIWADTGGTFTDIIAHHHPSDSFSKFKILSSSSIRGEVSDVSPENDSLNFKSTQNVPDAENFWKNCRIKFFETKETSCPPEGETNILSSWGTSIKIQLKKNNRPLSKALIGAKIEIISPEKPPVLAARILTQIPHNQPLPTISFNVATTLATNALLENKTPPVTLFINEGLEDLLNIGTQQRADLFSLKPQHTSFSPDSIVPISARLSPKGEELNKISKDEILKHTDRLTDIKNTQAAVCLLHSPQNPCHEEKTAQILQNMGMKVGGLSSEISPFIKIIDRAETTVVNAALEPVMMNYIKSIEESGQGHRIRIMTSAGSMTDIRNFRAKDSLLSGPAGGVVGIGWISRILGRKKTIGLDMGGTSTDVSRYEGGPVLRYQHKVGTARINGPSVEIETVAAGGGSICTYDDGLLRVGPESAGSSPGPACYGQGGPLTLTDVNLLAGRMKVENFGIPISKEKSEAQLDQILNRIVSRMGKKSMTREQLISGFLDIANEHMAEAIRKISVREGYDPKEYSLVAFGGAGGQHGCEVAEKLGIEEVICPADAGILSARGLNQARDKSIGSIQLMTPLTQENTSWIESKLNYLEELAISDLKRQGISEEIKIESRIAEVRVMGHEYCESVNFKKVDEIRDLFFIQFEKVFGFKPNENSSLELVNLRTIATTPRQYSKAESFLKFDEQQCFKDSKKEKWDGHLEYIERAELDCRAPIINPSVIQDKTSTVYMPRNWVGLMGTEGTILLQRERRNPTLNSDIAQSKNQLVETEIYANRFSSIAEQMGEMLKRTSVSTNVKERLDFSCAVLDSNGYLVANAPHIPVHLGALGTAVRAVIQNMPLEPGDMIVTNHPGYGGSHLPDITLVQPVFDETNNRIGFVANRAHHAEIGGVRSGSMPPNAKFLTEEGVVIEPTYLFRKGQSRIDAIREKLKNAPYPTRQIEENIADLTAQAAANFKGESLIKELVAHATSTKIQQIMASIREQATHCFKAKLEQLNGFRNSAIHKLDDGHQICLHLEISDSRLKLDFSGTSEFHPGNLNANPGIVRSVILYGIRLWVDKPIPLNDGLLDLVDLRLPKCFLNPEFPSDPDKCPAVVGGNTETSQMIFETFASATGIMAGSQGTMNNFIFGNQRYSFYETIGGGTGAGNGFHGSDAIHSHMTNTAITDPEILESKYPVRLLKNSIRNNSGGRGRFRGGNGIHREVQFLEPMQINILSHQRTKGPRGSEGGSDGQAGEQYILRPLDSEEQQYQKIYLKHIDQFEAEAGDIFVIKTPGGGAYGAEK